MDKFFYHVRKMPNMVRPVDIFTAFDRTRVLFDCKAIEPIIAIGTYGDTLPFDTICDDRAQLIAAKAKSAGKRVAVFWSGGIDSTLALVAIRKVAPDSEITVVLNEYSIKEYPWYFEQLRCSDVVFAWVSRADAIDQLASMITDHVVVTGELGDQAFGSVKYKSFPDYSDLMKPWDSFLNVSDKAAMEKFEHFVAACPAPIKTVKEFWWWISYALKYQGVCFRMLGAAWDAVLEEHVFHFFHSAQFNDWAVSTPMEEKFPGIDERKYKQIAKDYIFKQTRDADYQLNKLKEVSLNDISSARGVPLVRWVATDWSKG